MVVDTALRLSAIGLLDRENADVCGVSVSAVRHWRSGRRRIDRPVRLCPRCDHRLNEPAYAYLLGLYLGDGWLTGGRREVFALSISCCDAWPGLIAGAVAAMSDVMPASKVFKVQRVGCTEVKSASKHWPCLFPQHGPGRKHLREIRLASWQQQIVDAHPGAFVRGLIHSDGCRFTNRVRRPLADGTERWYEYPRYMFTNESADIRDLCCQALDLLGVAWRQSNRNTISVARREAVARLDEFVGPKF